MDIKPARRDSAIMCIRILAMLFIFTDHAVAYLDIPLKSIIIQVTNSGNLIFLFISGFLYGGKTIQNFKSWLKHKIVQLWIPYICFVVFYFVLYLFQEGIAATVKPFLIYSLVLQGLLGTEGGPATLWFMTLLIFCYFLIPFLQKIRESVWKMSPSTKALWVVAIVVVQILLAYFCPITLDFGHPLSWYWAALFVFSLGYLIRHQILNHGVTNLSVLLWTIGMVISVSVRLIGNSFLDGTVLYDRIISIWSNVILDIWIFFIVYYVVKKRENWFNCSLVHMGDQLSYPFYLVHATILTYTARLQIHPLFFLAVSFALVVVFAWILQLIAGKIQKRVSQSSGVISN